MDSPEVRIAVLEEKVNAQRREIDLQAIEYERRLSELNKSSGSRQIFFQILANLIAIAAIAAIIWSRK